MIGQGGWSVRMQTNGGAWLAGGELGILELGWENCTSGGGIGGGVDGGGGDVSGNDGVCGGVDGGNAGWVECITNNG